MKKKIMTQYGVCALTLAAALMTPMAQAQPAGETAGSSEDFLRQSAKSDHGTFRQRPAGSGEAVRKRHDETGRAHAADRRST
jgi:hypothetical protein